MKQRSKILMATHSVASLILLAACGTVYDGAPPSGSPGIVAEVWADNWFEMFVDGEKVLEDSVPITTERSFNAERTTLPGERPKLVAFKAMDFKENDSGLEYIGTPRQQMGDGGLIAQLRDNETGEIVAATDSSTRCLVVHRAPVDRSCASESNPMPGSGACDFQKTDIPENWTGVDFDDSAWPAAVEHSAQDVRPKDGYDEIEWDPSAKLIWSSDLVQDNTLLCRMTMAE